MLVRPEPSFVISRLIYSLADFEEVALEVFLQALDSELPIGNASEFLQRQAESHGFDREIGNDALTDVLAQAKEDACTQHFTRGQNAALDARAAQEEIAPLADWASLCARDSRGRPLPTLQNAMVALRHDLLGELVRYDEMMLAPILVRPINPDDPGIVPRRLADNDVSAIQERLQIEGLRQLGNLTAHQAIDLRAQELRFHPVRDYLDNLTWDGTARLDSLMPDYFGAPRTPYCERIGAMFLIAMVARVQHPGCKADHMLVIEGEQGTLKSIACRVLAGDYFSDSMPDIASSADKDAKQHLRGKWLCEIAEMHAMSRAENGQLKAFLSREVEDYRPAYGRKEVIEPRQCVFVGTTNKAAYLRDETGGRRFWPVATGRIDIDRLRRDRDHLFAEAMYRYRAGERWWPDRAFEIAVMKPEQDARYEGDPWEELISEYVTHNAEARPTSTELARQAIGIESAKIGTADHRRIGAIMERAGWRRQQKDRRGDIRWAPR